VEMKPVASSNIQAVGFENGELMIRFANGRTYRYTGPKVAEHHEAFMKAESKGRYFAQHIRNCSQTQCERHEEPSPTNQEAQ